MSWDPKSLPSEPSATNNVFVHVFISLHVYAPTDEKKNIREIHTVSLSLSPSLSILPEQHMLKGPL